MIWFVGFCLNSSPIMNLQREREFPNIPLNKNPDWASVQN